MRLHFRTGTLLQSCSDEEIVVVMPHRTLRWDQPSACLQKWIQQLTGYGSDALYTEEESLSELFYLLELLKKQTLLSYTILLDDQPLATLTPHLQTQWQLKTAPLEKDEVIQLSRFSYLRVSQEQTWILESPLIEGELILKHPACLKILSALQQPITVNQLSSMEFDIPQESLHSFVSLLYQADLLSLTDQNPALMCWEFHDLLFHARSRGRTSNPKGASFRFLNQIPPLPPVKAPTHPTVALFKPNLTQVSSIDPSLTQAIEERKSIRIQGTAAISAEQLGEFLYRTARIKGERPGQHYQATSRPYPGGGACYELELYPLIHRCEGLKSGLYHYLPDTHALELYDTTDDSIQPLLDAARGATGFTEDPQILILIAARFQRVNWKYESMAYSVILKNVGALMQTFYLVATAMELAPCAIGSGSSDLFTKAMGSNYYEETTVGEFILGSRAK